MKTSRPNVGVYYINSKTNSSEPRWGVIYDNYLYNPHHSKIKRSNDSSKRLALSARMLLECYRDMLNQSDDGILIVDHEFISDMTKVGNHQNNNLHKQISDIFNINYHKLYVHNGIRFRYVFVISYTKESKNILVNIEPLISHAENQLKIYAAEMKKHGVVTERSLLWN